MKLLQCRLKKLKEFYIGQYQQGQQQLAATAFFA